VGPVAPVKPIGPIGEKVRIISSPFAKGGFPPALAIQVIINNQYAPWSPITVTIPSKNFVLGLA